LYRYTEALKARQVALAQELRAMKESLQGQLADFTGINLPNPDYQKYEIRQRRARLRGGAVQLLYSNYP
jgi:hypothetical protein